MKSIEYNSIPLYDPEPLQDHILPHDPQPPQDPCLYLILGLLVIRGLFMTVSLFMISLIKSRSTATKRFVMILITVGMRTACARNRSMFVVVGIALVSGIIKTRTRKVKKMSHPVP